MDLDKALGLGAVALRTDGAADRRAQIKRANLRLAATGLPATSHENDAELSSVAEGVLARLREAARVLHEHRSPADARIEAFLKDHFAPLQLPFPLRLPDSTFVLDRHGLARELSLPVNADEFKSELLESYRVRNGVLHNPRSDRRTTAGTFHVAEGGLPIPGDKRSVPQRVFAEMFRRAMIPPDAMLLLPFTANETSPARCFVSLMLRPVVCPEVPGVCPAKTMEVRFFAPGTLVSNLDFVESIFGNAGDPFLPENDAGLDVEHWTGHTGCVILAPHLCHLTKQELGLPHFDSATPRQRQDKMCWKQPGELYNDGMAFKLTCRTEAGVIVTLIADNYYGYCKKEVKTQISYAANLSGNFEEEHAGGAIAFASFNLGDEYYRASRPTDRTFADVARDYGAMMDLRPQGYGIDKIDPNLVYIPQDSHASVPRNEIWWTKDGAEQSIPLSPEKIYIKPNGYKLRIARHPGAPSWRLIGTIGEGVFCHKPCTVSGGGKSEISKSLGDYMLYGPLFTSDADKDLDMIEQILAHDFSHRWKPDARDKPDYSDRADGKSRPILSRERSLGSVIKLLTPSDDFTDEYNAWLASVPNYLFAMLFIIKRFYKPDWGANWREHFNVDIVNGFPGHEFKFNGRKLVGTYLRVGLTEDGHSTAWRTYKVRQDFMPAAKVQTEDDISASVVVPTRLLSHLNKYYDGHQGPSVKFLTNCEHRLFQRPDDAVHRGLDRQTERDLARQDNFISNFQPLSNADAVAMVQRAAEFDQFTQPMQKLLRDATTEGNRFVVSSADPRLVDGKPSKNPRYLQIRPDIMDPLSKRAAEVGERLYRAVPLDKPLLTPVNAVLVGRRNNPPDNEAGIRGLAVYSPLHYQELPELFMDFICSLTGKSPSTTGAGTEGALTKSPFNALRPTADLNTAIVSYILTGLAVFSSSAGYVGPHVRVDHDISLLVPEIWCRLSAQEQDPRYLLKEGMLEPVADFDANGETIHASRLGYRITAKFVQNFFGRVFDNPNKVFDEAMLKPETQDRAAYIDGIKNITETQEKVAKTYFEDGSIEEACPPLKALLTIMAKGTYEGMTVHDAKVRDMFTLDYLLASDWYQKRLRTKQARDIALWQRHVAYLNDFAAKPSHRSVAQTLEINKRQALAQSELARVSAPQYLTMISGCLGADPLGG
ncbi:MAG: hypothetical protein H7144_02925 [Burkholderiales bacterium]|nr:hypothetical protein [Phycisphaerae bacterium]